VKIGWTGIWIASGRKPTHTVLEYADPSCIDRDWRKMDGPRLGLITQLTSSATLAGPLWKTKPIELFKINSNSSCVMPYYINLLCTYIHQLFHYLYRTGTRTKRGKVKFSDWTARRALSSARAACDTSQLNPILLMVSCIASVFPRILTLRHNLGRVLLFQPYKPHSLFPGIAGTIDVSLFL
jgi:hypothetical protein